MFRTYSSLLQYSSPFSDVADVVGAPPRGPTHYLPSQRLEQVLVVYLRLWNTVTPTFVNNRNRSILSIREVPGLNLNPETVCPD